MRRALILCCLFGCAFWPARGLAAGGAYGLLPVPSSIVALPCVHPVRLDHALRVSFTFDPAALEEINERWSALGIAPLVRSSTPDIRVGYRPGVHESYALRVSGAAVSIKSADTDGGFDAAMTLAQLAQRGPAGWYLPCVSITDAPALRWRILSDDVSRGPLPTMRYFKERIRTIAAFKMNGYSPYMEHVFAGPREPLPAPADGITPSQLAELSDYAWRFHVAFIPEQQTFAHMHNTLRFETYAPAAELPHGYLMSPVNPITYRYLERILRDEYNAIAASNHAPPFFHIGADEPSDLGRGQTQAAVAQAGDAAVYAAHVNRVAQIVRVRGTRVMLWDDAIQRHPDVLDHIPRDSVIVNWHYGSQQTYVPFIRTMAARGFDQMVAPGALNWNEIFPDVRAALPNEQRFITEGKDAHVLGLFQTVWHDDGESLYEATWYPVLFAAANAWQSIAIAPDEFATRFPHAFFGSDEVSYARDIVVLGSIVARLKSAPTDTTDYLFWSDALDPRLQRRLAAVDFAAVRRDAESILVHAVRPPMHVNAFAVMQLAARRLDYLGRAYQIGSEARWYYDDARAHADGKHDGLVFRGLFVTKYLFWEMRDNLEELASQYAAAWDYENRRSHRASVLERYHLAAQQAIVRADKINAMTYEEYVHRHRFPTFDEVLGPLPQ
ncbi:MAG: hypothetical protein DLM50_04350 [Candidatus Meridianibacter frigidus]|nr:MAG: hypothetical protein DLM50_04350 [Candidatus Eremiobacteraeota bacterium]